MNRANILERIDYLMDAQSWSRITQKILTDTQRMCICQERAALMHCLDQLSENPHVLVRPRYRVPENIEIKIAHVHLNIEQTHWIKPLYD